MKKNRAAMEKDAGLEETINNFKGEIYENRTTIPSEPD
jgi:hypothetical protein